MPAVISFFMLAFLPLGAIGGEEGPVRIELRAESVVGAAFFRLGDVASVDADDTALKEELSALRIGRSPRAGAVLALKRSEVENAIARLKPENKGRLQISGARNLTVRRGPLQTLEYERVRDAAARALEAFLAERFARFEVEPLAEGPPIVVPEGRIELKPRIASAGPTPARLSVWTDVYVDGLHYQSLPVAFSVRGYRAILSARSALRPGSRLRADDFLVREEQTAGYADSPVPVDLDLSKLRLRRPLGAGEVLTWRQADQAPAVSRNQEIRVLLTVGGITLETAGTATQDARPGEIVRVRAAGQQSYSARVTGAGTVEALWR